MPTDDGTLPGLTATILGFLRARQLKATFFVVGAVAEAHPELIEAIAADDHEVALHTCHHTPLPELDARTFELDVRKGVETLARFTPDGRVRGFRAPFFSLSRSTSWAFDVLKDSGFVYDSSVLPIWHPVCGWFAGQSKFISRLENGLWSVPVSVLSLTARLGIPVGGGVYLRLLPEFVNHWAAKRYDAVGQPLNVYVHPYDIAPDAPTGQVFGHNALLNSVLRVRRAQMLPRLGRLIEGRRSWRVIDYLEDHEQNVASSGQ